MFAVLVLLLGLDAGWLAGKLGIGIRSRLHGCEVQAMDAGQPWAWEAAGLCRGLECRCSGCRPGVPMAGADGWRRLHGFRNPACDGATPIPAWVGQLSC
jgi:hypothetical protein